jgi:hypothetical protein
MCDAECCSHMEFNSITFQFYMVEVKLSLCIIKRHALKIFGGIALHILNLDIESV